MKSRSELTPVTNQLRQTEAAKTARLRALRLAKEAIEKETALREAAINPGKSKSRRTGSAIAATEAERSEPADESARE